MREIKREIRCKSGAIPVAVKESEWRIESGEWEHTPLIQPFLSCSKATIPLFAEWEGAANPEPEDLPDQFIVIQLSGERQEDISV